MTVKEEIINYLKEMAESDNRGTADPFYYTIQTEKEVAVPLDASDSVVYYSNELDTTFTSKEEYLAYVDDSYDGCERDEFLDTDEVTMIGIHKGWENKGMFLTEEEAKRHLKQNAYHYSENARTYVEHAWQIGRAHV